MEKICGFKAKDGYLYGTIEEVETVNRHIAKRDAMEELINTIVGEESGPLYYNGTARSCDMWLRRRFKDKDNMVAAYYALNNYLYLIQEVAKECPKAELKPLGFWKKLFK